MTHAVAATHHTSMGLDSRKMAFWAFIGSECLLFGSLISTYLVYKGRSVVGPYPHEILNIPFTSVSTFDLLMSSLMMVLALAAVQDRKSTRLNSSHRTISYAVFCLKKKKKKETPDIA